MPIVTIKEIIEKKHGLAEKPLYEFLSAPFLAAMNDIGRYGNEKYKEQSFHARSLVGDRSRGGMERNQTAEIGRHAKEHFEQYRVGILHDRFGTRKHQLAAAAFNAMMEFYYAGLDVDEL